MKKYFDEIIKKVDIFFQKSRKHILLSAIRIAETALGCLIASALLSLMIK